MIERKSFEFYWPWRPMIPGCYQMLTFAHGRYQGGGWFVSIIVLGFQLSFAKWIVPQEGNLGQACSGSKS